MSEQQWEEIQIEDVQPGDVARCNGREFPVNENSWPCRWEVQIPGGSALMPGSCNELGFTFHRKVKREPRTCVSTVQKPTPRAHGYVFSIAYLPGSWDNGTRVRVTELLDGEDGA